MTTHLTAEMAAKCLCDDPRRGPVLLTPEMSAALEAFESGTLVSIEASELERLRADAERYRWLRSGNVGHNELMHVVGGDDFPAYSEYRHGLDLDAAIDAARRGAA